MDIEDKQDLEWGRPSGYFQGSAYQVIKDIDINSIKQGSLGDCYFLSAISAVAEFPKRIARLFVSKKVPKCGAYCVNLCVNGIWQDIIVDDQMPINPDSGKLEFLELNNPQLWVPLL